MIEILEDVEQWTYGKIVDLVTEGYDENDILEFKREINLDGDRLIKTACAFANTNGGTIIFGIDNNRKKSLHLNDRILGVSDSDQLKRNIIDKIKNIQPNIPIKNIIFRKTNLKIPHKKEIIVILKITSSKDKPHQYKNIFYKRLSDGNEPMNVTEVKQIILESQKNKKLLALLLQECGLFQERLKEAKKKLGENEISAALISSRNQHFDSINYFMYNQSYLYSTDITQTLMRIVEVIHKISDCNNQYAEIEKLPSTRRSYPEKRLGVLMNSFVDDGLMHLSNLEQYLDLTLIPPYVKEEVSKKLDEMEKSKFPNKS